MRLRVFAVGRLREPSIRDVCEDYTQRIQRYLSFEVREVREAGHSDRDAAEARRVEATALLRAVPSGHKVVALTRTGTALTSEEVAALLASWQREQRDVAIVVGGAHGLDRSVLDTADDSLSLSPMTLPHELARLVLFEQLYRACTILRGEPYHKGGGE
ncbi:MAG: 23S rRNA (pseudouridine(1915)-N(3))-methyltransferase RlmH [Gemmatimonadota bacterium]|nr:23S rRNA (pseudouridine(1915)-N(3))-methyltransferase RlmH [Gemmatimonadota bacterium]